MKKTFCFILVFCLLLCVGCSRAKYPMDSGMYDLGKKALIIADGYLDAKISAEDAAASFDDLYEAADAYDRSISTKNGWGNSLVHTYIFSLHSDFFLADLTGDGVSYIGILETRDKLADILGEPSYK